MNTLERKDFLQEDIVATYTTVSLSPEKTVELIHMLTNALMNKGLDKDLVLHIDHQPHYETFCSDEPLLLITDGFFRQVMVPITHKGVVVKVDSE